MSTPDVTHFAWDDENERKVLANGVSPNSVDQLLETESYAVSNNRRGVEGSVQLVRKDFNGRYVTVIIQPTPGDATVWRLKTAWPSKAGEVTKARKQGAK